MRKKEGWRMFALYATRRGGMETRRELEFELYGDGFDLIYDGGYVVGRNGNGSCRRYITNGVLDLKRFWLSGRGELDVLLPHHSRYVLGNVLEFQFARLPIPVVFSFDTCKLDQRFQQK